MHGLVIKFIRGGDKTFAQTCLVPCPPKSALQRRWVLFHKISHFQQALGSSSELTELVFVVNVNHKVLDVPKEHNKGQDVRSHVSQTGFFSTQFWIFVPQIQLYSSPFLNWLQLSSEEPVIISAETSSIDRSCCKIGKEKSQHWCGITFGPKRDISPWLCAANNCCLLLDLVIVQAHQALAQFLNLI